MSPFNLMAFRFLLFLVSSAGLSLAHEVIPNGFSFDGIWMNPLLAALTAVAFAVAMVSVLSGCAWLCRDRFKSIEDDGPFPGMDFPNPPSGVDLGIYPPVEGTPDHVPISFDPLPDVSSLMRHKMLVRSNIDRLRPKVSHIVRDRRDSGEDLDSVTYRDSVQSKLEKVLTSVTKQNFERNQLNYIKELGTGWFGKVLQGDGQGLLPGHKRTSAIIQILREDADRFEQHCFLQESAPYREAEHPNVLKLLGCCVESVPYLTVLELCVNGDLRMYLRGQRSNIEMVDKQGLLFSFACDMAAGLQALHQQNYVHRDFAIRNCLVTSDLTVKIGDYGLSEEIYKDDYFLDPSGALIPIRWLAPEVISISSEHRITVRNITKDCNLWSFGVALWELVTFGSLPYAELSNEQVLRMVIYEGSVRLMRPEIPVANLHRMYQLMEMCWMAPAQRPSLRELRIMLLHLQSSKDELDALAFDQKWSQLMPRHSATMHNSIATIESHDITVLPLDEDEEFYYRGGMLGGSIMGEFQALHHSRDAFQPSLRMDSRFSELDPALLVHSGEFQSNLLPWATFESSSPHDLTLHREELRQIPIRELSLGAEFRAEDSSTFRAKKREEEEDFLSQNKQFDFVSALSNHGRSTKPDQSSKVTARNSTDRISHVAEVHRPSVDLQEDIPEKLLLNSVPNGSGNSLSDAFRELNGEDGLDKINSGSSVAVKEDGGRTSGEANAAKEQQKTEDDLCSSLVTDLENNNRPMELLNFVERKMSATEENGHTSMSRELSRDGAAATPAETDGVTVTEDRSCVNQHD